MSCREQPFNPEINKLESSVWDKQVLRKRLLLQWMQKVDFCIVYCRVAFPHEYPFGAQAQQQEKPSPSVIP
jgi:hypothetical protein